MKTTISNQTKSGATDRDTIIGSAISKAMVNASSADPCPTVEQLAVLVDGGGTEKESDSLFGHMAVCARCREVYLLANSLSSEEPVQRNYRGWYMAGGTLAAVALVVLAVKLTLSPEAEIRTAHTVTTPAAQVAQIPATPAAAPHATGPDANVAQKSAVTVLNLVSPEEAAQPRIRSYGFAGSTQTDGPDIHIEAPAEVTDGQLISAIRISFAPCGGNVPNLASLRLEYLKQNPVDLTPRVKEFANGSDVILRRVRLPEGLHNFRVVIADMQGRISEKDFTIMVSGPF